MFPFFRWWFGVNVMAVSWSDINVVPTLEKGRSTHTFEQVKRYIFRIQRSKFYFCIHSFSVTWTDRVLCVRTVCAVWCRENGIKLYCCWAHTNVMRCEHVWLQNEITITTQCTYTKPSILIEEYITVKKVIQCDIERFLLFLIYVKYSACELCIYDLAYFPTLLWGASWISPTSSLSFFFVSVVTTFWLCFNSLAPFSQLFVKS